MRIISKKKEDEIEKRYRDIFSLSSDLVKENTALITSMRKFSLTIGIINIVVLVFILAVFCL